MANSDLKELSEKVLKFTQDRDWDQFHNPKDLAIAISIEASELLEAFLWKKPKEAKSEKIKEELADIINYAILLADKCNLDIYKIVSEKLQINSEKYPIEKAKGTAKKYNEL
jgi:NTP pyrophosphatase (non-canonical NTP hydrolase)